MTFSFNGAIAEKYGVNEAILLNHLYFWVIKNEGNSQNFFVGRYWTYNSAKAFKKVFPFWSERTIQRIIKSLVDEGLVLVGNFNNDPRNRTNYYTLSDKGIGVMTNWQVALRQNDVMQYGKMAESYNLSNSIENSYTENNIQNITDIPLISPEEKLELLFDDFWKAYPKKANKKDAFKAFKSIKNIEQALPDILADVEMKKDTKDWQKDNGQFIPYPGSYLRGERWNDVNEVAEKQAAINEAISDEIGKFLF